MRVTAIRTAKVQPGDNLFELLDSAITDLAEASVVVVTSKIVSLAEGNVVAFDETDKKDLITSEAELYLPDNMSKYGHKFTITKNTLIASAGIDESNGGGYYVLWPKDAQASANAIRQHLSERFKLANVGVVITDSTCQPLRRGATGIILAHSGFKALRNYIGQPDIFGRPFEVSQANVAGGLAAAAVVTMGEGAEQTPLAMISDVPFVEFQPRDPSADELKEINISLDEDLFAPFLKNAPWQPGHKK